MSDLQHDMWESLLLVLPAPILLYSTTGPHLAVPAVVPAPQWHESVPRTASGTCEISTHQPLHFTSVPFKMETAKLAEVPRQIPSSHSSCKLNTLVLHSKRLHEF